MTIRIMLRRSSLVALALGALLSCSGDKSPTDPGKDGKDDTPQPTSLVLSNDALAFAALGDSARLEATVRDQNNFPVPDADITWSSTDTAIAKVNTNGWVSAVANGTARIIATSGALADTATIEVAQAPATIELGTDSVSLAPGDTMRLAGVVSDANGAEIPDAEITWASEDENVAAVDDGGLVTGTSAGETLIMANAGEVADTVVVVVEPQPAEITVSPGLLVFDALGDSVLVTAVVHDSEGTVMEDAAIHLTSTDSAVAMVSEDGWVVSRGNGTARIIVSSGEFSDTAQVEVAQVPVTLALAPETLQFTALLDSTRLVPTVSDRRGFAIPDPSVVWTSTDSAIASVDDDGWVISRGNGDVQIEATVGALTATVPVAVSQVIARIAVTPEATRLGTGDTVRLGATFVDSNDVEVEDVVATIVWQSADPLIASVDPTTGLVTAHRPGGATTIKAQAGVHTGTADLSVKDQIAFTRASRIWLMNEDGMGQVQLTFPLGDRLPVWAPDGSKIAFTSTRDVVGKLEIYVMNADGSGQTRLTNTTGDNRNPSWSPDGSKIVFDSGRDGVGNLFVMNADGSNQTKLATGSGQDWMPTWSPDGTRIAYICIRGIPKICTIDAAGTTETILSDSLSVDRYPVWSPDGSKIAVQRDLGGGNTEVFVMNADGSNPVNLTNSPGTDADAAWSPDGTRIAFVSKRDGSSQIYLMNADGSPGATRLSYDLDEAQYPRWSPDGSSIIFVGVKDGKYDLYRVSANGGIAENVTNTDGELEDHPAWRPRP